MPDQTLKQRAEALLAKHQPGNPVILPTVWDAWSARLAVDAGFAALTVGSHPVASSVGKEDWEGMTFTDLLTRVKQITEALDARTDLFQRQDGEESDRVDRAIARLKAAASEGADVLYPVGRHDAETLRRLATELPLPINAIAVPDSDDPASFGPLGVGRISFGPFLQGALSGRVTEILQRWA